MASLGATTLRAPLGAPSTSRRLSHTAARRGVGAGGRAAPARVTASSSSSRGPRPAPASAPASETAEAVEGKEGAKESSGGSCPFHSSSNSDLESQLGFSSDGDTSQEERREVVEIPGPLPLPFDLVQNMYHVLKIPIYGIEEALMRWGKSFGPIVRFDNTNTAFDSWVFINDPKLIEHVCSRNARNYFDRYLPDVYSFAMEGKGLLASTGQYNMEHRKMCKAPFQRKVLLQNFATTMAESATRMTEVWEANAVDGVVHADMANHMQRLTLDVIGQVAFSYDFGGVSTTERELQGGSKAELDEGDRLLDLVNISNEELGRFSTPFIKRPVLELGEQIGEGCVKRMLGAFKDMRELCNPMIDARREQMINGEEVPGDLMTSLIETQLEQGVEGYTNTELWEDIHDVMGAGHETTANTLTFAMLETALHPEVDDRVLEEVQRVLGGRAPTYEDYENLPYCTAVVKEVLRLYPSIPLFPRQCKEDDQLPSGHMVQAGDVVFMSAYTMGRTEAYWPEPLKFKPERFSAEEEAKRPPFTWVQFGAGPRMCLGANFAMMSTVLMYATLLQKFKFNAISPNYRTETTGDIPYIGAWRGGVPFEYDLTIKIPGGVEMEAILRK